MAVMCNFAVRKREIAMTKGRRHILGALALLVLYLGYQVSVSAFAHVHMVHTPSFFELNLKLNYTFVIKDHIKLQVNCGVQNMFNAFQKDLDKGKYRDSGYFYGPTQPRTFFVGLQIMN